MIKTERGSHQVRQIFGGYHDVPPMRRHALPARIHLLCLFDHILSLFNTTRMQTQYVIRERIIELLSYVAQPNSDGLGVKSLDERQETPGSLQFPHPMDRC